MGSGRVCVGEGDRRGMEGEVRGGTVRWRGGLGRGGEGEGMGIAVVGSDGRGDGWECVEEMMGGWWPGRGGEGAVRGRGVGGVESVAIVRGNKCSCVPRNKP